MEIEIGLVVKQVDMDRTWEIIASDGRAGYWTIQLLATEDPNGSYNVGYRAIAVRQSWFDNYCVVVRRPSIAGPIGDGVMFAFIHTDTEFTQRLQLEGSAETLIEWITEQCGRLASPTCKTVTVEWWGYDAHLGEVIGLDLEPDMVATWELEHEELVWRES